MLNIYVSNNRASKCMKHNMTELQSKLDKTVIIIRVFTLSSNNKTFRGKISQDRVDWNNTISQLD